MSKFRLMKYSILILITLACIIWSCNNDPKKSSETTIQEDVSNPGKNKNGSSNQECYSYATERDSVFLQLERLPKNAVTGNLIFKYFEKDSNHGDINGKFYGDTLIADYTFMSEGIQSTRQVIFHIKDNVAVQGYGAMQVRDGKIIFSNPKEVDFSMGTKLNKITCPARNNE